jgi:predicted  nucleic acid-binding Zn-ribbon protein
MSDTPRTQNAFAIANLHTTKRMKSIYDEMAKLESELYDARKKATTAWSDNLILDSKNRQLERELAEAREQRDGAFSLIDYAGELLGVPKQEHKSAHGFKILQAIKELAAMKGNSR